MDIFSGDSSESLYARWIQRVRNDFPEKELQELHAQQRGCFFPEDYHAIYDQVLKKQQKKNDFSNDSLTVRYHCDNITEEGVKLLPELLKSGVDKIVLFRDFSTQKDLLDLVVKLIPIDQLIPLAKMDFANEVNTPKNPVFYHHLAISEGAENILKHISGINTSNSEVWLSASPENGFYEVLGLLRSIKILNTYLKNDFHLHLICDLSHDQSFEKALVHASVLSLAGAIAGIDSISYKLPQEWSFNHLWYFHHIPSVLFHEASVNSEDAVHGSWFFSSLAHSLLNKSILRDEKKGSSGKIHTFAHLNSVPGEPPFLRGPYASMYLRKPWTLRQYAGFSTAEESNAFYKQNLKAGQTGLSVAFDLATHRGYDSDHERVRGDVGMAGVAIDSVDDMKLLFDEIDLSKMSVSMTMNGAVFPILAFYIIAAEEQGVSAEKLSGTIQNDILKEFLVRNTYIYPPDASMRLVTDIFRYTSQHMPKFNPISISGYHMHEAGASAAQELAFTLADGIEYVNAGIAAGIKVDQFAPRLSFFWGIGMNFYLEIAKLRAGRFLWAELMSQFKPENEKSLMLRTHCQTSGWSLTAQAPLLNIVRTTIEALSAVFGHTQSLHTNSYDEALALPTEESAAIARYTQLYLQKTGITGVVDPFAGSEKIEMLTQELIEEARKILKQVEQRGGMLVAIKKGWAKQQIENQATQRQADIDKGEEVIIGVNRYFPPSKNPLPLRDIDNRKVLEQQLQRLSNLKANRDENAVFEILNQLEDAAKKSDAPLFELCLEAARRRATLGEISLALENVFGRHQAVVSAIQGVYLQKMKNDLNVERARELCEEFEKKDGRRPRMLVAKLGQDGHDRGAHLVASVFSDLGFDVDLGPMFSTAEEIARQAMENDVHIIGISSMTGAHKILIPELLKVLEKMGLGDVLVVAGGIIPEKDAEELVKVGVHAVFGPGTVLGDAAVEMLEFMLRS